MPTTGGNIFLEINKNNSFTVSRTSVDLSGIYFVKYDGIRMSSEDTNWFNRDWIISCFSDRMIFTAIGPIKTQLRFNKIDKIPNFEEFESDIVGKWQLYKVRSKVLPILRTPAKVILI